MCLDNNLFVLSPCLLALQRLACRNRAWTRINHQAARSKALIACIACKYARKLFKHIAHCTRSRQQLVAVHSRTVLRPQLCYIRHPTMGAAASSSPPPDERELQGSQSGSGRLLCHLPRDVDIRKLKKLIKSRRLAPCHPGCDDDTHADSLDVRGRAGCTLGSAALDDAPVCCCHAAQSKARLAGSNSSVALL